MNSTEKVFSIMGLLEYADRKRVEASIELNPLTKSALGQFMTPASICLFMASLFKRAAGDISLLDPGCGVGSLSAAFTARADKDGANSLNISAFDVEPVMKPFLQDVMNECGKAFSNTFVSTFSQDDFIVHMSGILARSKNVESGQKFTHVIMNPPYKKISNTSVHRQALRDAGIETVNLYSGFVALAIKLLKPGGELVAIIPRSFCNGPYYQSFRELLLNEMTLHHIHIFDTRNTAFSDDDVLQENIIVHCIKGRMTGDEKVTITSSPTSDFRIDDETGQVTATDMTLRKVELSRIVNPDDAQKFIHIAATPIEQQIIDRLAPFSTSLTALGIQVSTGPVVNFRLKNDLRNELTPGSVPLLFPQHLNEGIRWPLDGKKPNAIHVSAESRPWLWANEGYFLVIKRFSSKEEKRRIVSTVYDSSLPGELIGVENKTNVFHINKKGMDKDLACGLNAYLNCTLLDRYYRQFGGHTQVNATDLRSLHYPDAEVLRKIGREVGTNSLSQEMIDRIINRELDLMNVQHSHFWPCLISTLMVNGAKSKGR